ATLTGNPQNMLIGSLSGQRYADFFLHLLPVAVPALALTALILRRFFREEMSAGPLVESPATPVLLDRKLLRLTLSVAAITMAGFFAGGHLAWTALAGAAAVMVLSRRDPAPALARVDWTVLLFFAALFVVVGGINRTSLPGEVFRAADAWLSDTAARQAPVLAAVSVVGSNAVSNVPFILLVEPWVRTLVEADLMWRVLAMSTTFAGNLTLLGSVANIIVFESARHVCPIGFWEYARVGIPVTLATTLVGTVVLCAVHAAR
ncbi:MAG: SLC13 family permease, partial [Candidatus Binatia bacterium]